ncbi:MAG: hypothetical protein LBU22_01555, partial [Dysgonamonadaceae bacterium]|nr:hypothetical protein [Dysgonamonadaceae bacterium]
MIKLNVIINRPVEDVWNYFTNISNWSKWDGGEIISAEWKKGGSVTWGMGAPSQINNYEFQKLVTLGSTWIDTNYRFSPCNGGTLFTIEEGSPKNASWSDGGVKHTRELEDSLKKLKQNIESSGKIEAGETTINIPENMSVEDFIKQSLLSNLLNIGSNKSETENNIPNNSRNDERDKEKVMKNNLIICSDCGRATGGSVHIAVVSGKEKEIGKNKNGKMVSQQIPDTKHEFTVCEDCYNDSAAKINKMRPVRIFLGLLLIPVTLALVALPCWFVFGNADSFWLDMGGGVQVLPWYAILVMFLVLLVPAFISGKIAASSLKHGFANTRLLVTEKFETKYCTEVLSKLKKADANGQYFTCTEKQSKKIPEANDIKWTEVREPLPPAEEELLSSPCTINFKRISGVVGAAMKLHVYMNGQQMGAVKNGKTISFQTNVKNNILFVLDHAGNAFPSTYRFVAEPDTSVSVLFDGKFLSQSAPIKFQLNTVTADTFVAGTNGSKKNDLEPEKTIRPNVLADDDAQRVTFVSESKDDSSVWMVYTAPSKADAMDFLSQQDIDKPLYYVVVETPEGNFGKDKDGF